MTNLTEKWKKGELPSGWYYVRLIRGEYRIDLYINGKNEWIDCPDNIIDTVVCKVPSYELWKAKLEENTKLKERLKECKHIMSIEKDFASCHFEKDRLCKILTKINQVLGEE